MCYRTHLLCESKYVTLHFRDRRGAASLRYRNRAEITVLMCKHKPYPVWFSCRRKSYPVYCEHSLRLDSRKPSDWFASHPCLHSCVEIMTGRTILCADSTSPGTLRNHDGDGNENARKATGLMSKTTILHVHHAFLYITLPSLHDYDVKISKFTFRQGLEHKTTTFFFFSWTLIQSFRIGQFAVVGLVP